MERANLFDGIPARLEEEHFSRLLDTGDVRIERIVSRGHSSPPGFWYDQDEHEWVLVLRGSAALRFEGTDSPLQLRAGDHVHIAAHVRHRVESTDVAGETVWLAVFYRSLP